MLKNIPFKNILTLMGFLVGGGLFTLSLGQDANFDLKNYHFYNAYAYLNNRYEHDLAPAQLQTYLNPLLDLAYYKLVIALSDPILVTFALGLWYGLFAWATFRLLQLLQPKQNIIVALLGTILGVSGVGALGQTGTATHEMTTAALMMLSVVLCISGLKTQEEKSYQYIRLAGLVTGITVGSKLTAVAFAAALFSGLAFWVMVNHARYTSAIIVHFVVMSIFGFLITGGYWHYFLWRHYDSPLFPFYNNFFQSPYYEHVNLSVWQWRATTWEQLLTYAFQLSQINRPLKEEMFSDPRLSFGFISAIVLVIYSSIKLIKRRPAFNNADFNVDNKMVVLMLAIMWLVAYFLWAYLQGIYRYASFLEALSAILVVTVLYQYRLHARWIAAIMLCIALLSIHYTNYLSWGRINYGLNTFEVHPPTINNKALVIMLSSRPMSYVIPFFPKEIRFVSPENNFNEVKFKNKLQRKINQTIEFWNGPLYAMAPYGYNFMQDEVLKEFSLRIDYVGDNACKPILSNIDQNAIQICGLTRE